MPDDRYSTEIWTFRNIGGFKTYLIPVRGKREPVLPPPLPMWQKLRTVAMSARHLGGIPRYGTAHPTICWNAGAATEPP
jgi:hypothetical protein